MGGIVTKEPVTEAHSSDKGNESRTKSYRSPRSSSGLRGVLAGSLNSSTECFELPNLVQRLQIYQHYESGEIMLLINEPLSDATPGVEDATEWVQVFLNTQNEHYLERITTPVAVPFGTVDAHASKFNPSASSDADRNSRETSKESKEGDDDARMSGLSNDSGLTNNFNEFSLSMEKLDRRTHRHALERREREDDDAKQVVLFKDARMNEEYEPFLYHAGRSRRDRASSHGENRNSTTVSTTTVAQEKYNYERSAVGSRAGQDSKLSSPRNDNGGRESRREHCEECPYCMRAIPTTEYAGGGSSGDEDSLVPASESFATHKRVCGFSLYVMPRFSQLDAAMRSSLVELNKHNEGGMEKALVKAIRAFEKRSALNNCTLLLIKKAMSLGDDHMLSRGHGSDPMEVLEQRVIDMSKEVQSFLLRLRTQAAEQKAEKEQGTLGEGALGGMTRPNSLSITNLSNHDGDSDDECLDLLEDGGADSERGHAVAHGKAGEDPRPGHAQESKAAGEQSNAPLVAVPKAKGRFFCSLQELEMYIKVAEKLLLQCNAKKTILRHHQSATIGIRDFEFVSMLGKGGFASVHLVRNRNDGKSYALKAISKGPLGDTNTHMSHMQLLNEQHVSLMSTKFMASAFVNLRGSFQTPKFCCLVLELCPGGDCLTLLNNVASLPEETVRLIIAEVVQAVAWLHTHGVLHRDIKPDNLFITSTGHVKLGDFGVCTKMWHSIGTPSTSLLGYPPRKGRSASAGSDVSTKVSGVLGPGSNNTSLSASGRDTSDSSGVVIPGTAAATNYTFDARLWAAMDSDITPQSLDGPAGPQSGSSSPRYMIQSGNTSARSGDFGSEASSTSMVYRHDVNDHLHYTMVGNHHYQSPECLSQEGYDRSEDWWAVAVLCFHLLAGITPFEAKHGCTEAEERENIVLAKILWDNLPMGGTRLSPECRDFITRMLRENKVERLSYQSTGAVREHAFFEGISFESLWKGRGPIKLELSGSGSNYIHQELEDDMAMALPALWRENNDSLLPSDAAQRRKDELSRFKTINNF